ncbi:MAG: aldo/keto reductase [Rubrivivax sp.]
MTAARSLSNERTLGRTGASIEAVSLGGEGILRTRGRTSEAAAMILAALEHGVRYCDTAPAYDDSQIYYGEAFRRSPGARDRVFMASKTHERTRDGALALLEDSLRKLGTDRIDLWQMHDSPDEARFRGDLRSERRDRGRGARQAGGKGPIRGPHGTP